VVTNQEIQISASQTVAECSKRYQLQEIQASTMFLRHTASPIIHSSRKIKPLAELANTMVSLLTTIITLLFIRLRETYLRLLIKLETPCLPKTLQFDFVIYIYALNFLTLD